MDIDITLIIVGFTCFIIGVIIGEIRQAHRFIAKVSKDPDSMIALLTQLKAELARLKTLDENNLPEDAIEVRIEQVNDDVYAYNKATGEFLSQAQNLHQAMTLAAARFPGKKFWHPELKQDSQTA
jgi:hypothetical protein